MLCHHLEYFPSPLLCTEVLEVFWGLFSDCFINGYFAFLTKSLLLSFGLGEGVICFLVFSLKSFIKYKTQCHSINTTPTIWSICFLIFCSDKDVKCRWAMFMHINFIVVL